MEEQKKVFDHEVIESFPNSFANSLISIIKILNFYLFSIYGCVGSVLLHGLFSS